MTPVHSGVCVVMVVAVPGSAYTAACINSVFLFSSPRAKAVDVTVDKADDAMSCASAGTSVCSRTVTSAEATAAEGAATAEAAMMTHAVTSWGSRFTSTEHNT